MAHVSTTATREIVSLATVLEGETAIEGILINLRDDPEWLQLPQAKREIALTRFEVLQAYDRKKAPTKADAVAAASELGVQLRTFYFMLRGWRDKNRSMLALVPYRGDAKLRPSRLKSEVAEHLSEQVRKMLEKDPTIAPSKAVRTIESTWPKTLGRPSGVTIRAFIERLKASTPAEPGSFRLEKYTSSGEKMEVATRFGEVIVIDHTAPASLLIKGTTTTVPTVTLAIDLFSGLPIGAAVSENRPNAEAVLDALADACDRMEGLGAYPVQPRIVYASTPGSEWAMLRNELEEGGLAVVEQRDHRLQFGGSTKRLIGRKLGSIPLQPSKAGRSGAHLADPDHDALLTPNEMRLIIDGTIDRLVAERLLGINDGRAAKLQLPDRIAERRGLKARLTPLTDVTEKGCGESNNTDRAFWMSLACQVEEVIGPLLIEAATHHLKTTRQGWMVRVEINDGRQLSEVWLRLARKAIDIANAVGVLIRFEVAVRSSGEDEIAVFGPFQ